MEIQAYVADNCLLTRIACKRFFDKDDNIKIIGSSSSARECIEFLAGNKTDVLLLDTDLYDINGIETCKIIKTKYPKIKIIMCSDFYNKDRILASLACGADSYILKSTNKEHIKKIIKIVASGEFWLDYKIAKLIFSSIPIPNTKDLNNLYENLNFKHNLTSRELEVLRLLVDGKTNSQIAKEIIISTNTAKAHVGSIFSKLEVKDRVQAAVKAVRANIF